MFTVYIAFDRAVEGRSIRQFLNLEHQIVAKHFRPGVPPAAHCREAPNSRDRRQIRRLAWELVEFSSQVANKALVFPFNKSFSQLLLLSLPETTFCYGVLV